MVKTLEKRFNQGVTKNSTLKNAIDECSDGLNLNYAELCGESSKVKILLDLALEQLVTDHATKVETKMFYHGVFVSARNQISSLNYLPVWTWGGTNVPPIFKIALKKLIHIDSE